MGGANEDVIEKSKPQIVNEPARGEILQGSGRLKNEVSGIQSIPEQLQEIRTHLSGKNIHFHVDVEKLKVSIPLAQIEAYYSDLKTLAKREHLYYDASNSTLMKLQSGMNAQGQLDVFITITACQEGPVSQKLDKLISASRK